MIGDKKILAITLARGGSKRIPKKNIAELCGLPLIAYTLREAEKSVYIDHYVVSTDDEEIAQVVREHEVYVHKRNPEFAQDTSTSADAIFEVLNVFHDFDYIVEVMCTNPFKTVDDIDGCIEKFHESPNTDSVVSVVRIYDQHPRRVKYILNDHLKDFYPEVPESRRQDLTPPAYIRNGSIYVFDPYNIWGHRRRLINPKPFIMPPERSINIDEPLDLELARLMMEKQ